jgi:hypothetical protein
VPGEGIVLAEDGKFCEERGKDHESSSALTQCKLETGTNTGKRVHISSEESINISTGFKSREETAERYLQPKSEPHANHRDDRGA